jgi:hypothetical protein
MCVSRWFDVQGGLDCGCLISSGACSSEGLIVLEANRRPKMDEASRQKPCPQRHQLVASAGVNVKPEP